jgi:hypothetical protein
MTKNTLLAASAVAALMSGALPAFANDISGTGLYSGINNGDESSDAIQVAEELRFSSTFSTSTAFDATRGDLTFNFTSSGGTYPAGQLSLTLDVSNAVFSEDLAASSILTGTGTSNDTTCSPTASLSSGGEEGDSTVTLIVSGFETCDTSDALVVNLPIQMTGGGAVEAGVEIRTLAGNLPVDGGRDEVTFIELADAFTAEFTTDGVAVASVSSGYEDFNNDGMTVASLELGVNEDVYTTIALSSATSSSASTADITDIADVRITATAGPGSFSGFNLELEEVGMFGSSSTSTTSASANRVIVFDPSGEGTYEISVSDNDCTASCSTTGANGVIQTTSIALNAYIDLLANNTGTATSTSTASTGQFVDFSVTGSASVDRDGTSVIVPWIGSGTQSANGVTSLIRIGNNTDTATGAVFVRLLSAAPNSAVQPGDLELIQASIPAGGEYLMTQQQIELAIGGNFVRGDIEIVVEAEPEGLSLKRRDTRSGITTEMSLGSAERDSEGSSGPSFPW